MNIETGVSELLTNAGLGAYCHNDQPTWSPDGTQLAFVTRPKGGRSSIFVAKVDGTGGYSLVDDQYIDQAPAWSPDGMQLAFVSYRAARLPGGETGYPGTFIMDANDTAGTTIRQVGDVFDLSDYHDFADALAQIGHFIEEVYLTKRIHSALGYLTPLEFEAA